MMAPTLVLCYTNFIKLSLNHYTKLNHYTAHFGIVLY
jgi:hypothetical protein